MLRSHKKIKLKIHFSHYIFLLFITFCLFTFPLFLHFVSLLNFYNNFSGSLQGNYLPDNNLYSFFLEKVPRTRRGLFPTMFLFICVRLISRFSIFHFNLSHFFYFIWNCTHGARVTRWKIELLSVSKSAHNWLDFLAVPQHNWITLGSCSLYTFLSLNSILCCWSCTIRFHEKYVTVREILLYTLSCSLLSTIVYHWKSFFYHILNVHSLLSLSLPIIQNSQFARFFFSFLSLDASVYEFNMCLWMPMNAPLTYWFKAIY